MPDDERGIGRRAIDRATSLPAISIGFAGIILGGAYVAGQRVRDIERDIADQRAQLADLSEDLAEETVAREAQLQALEEMVRRYIGQGGSLTEDVRDLEDELSRVREWLAAQHGEVIP